MGPPFRQILLGTAVGVFFGNLCIHWSQSGPVKGFGVGILAFVFTLIIGEGGYWVAAKVTKLLGSPESSK